MLNDSHLRLIPIQSHFAEARELALEKLAAKKADGRVVTWECETHVLVTCLSLPVCRSYISRIQGLPAQPPGGIGLMPLIKS